MERPSQPEIGIRLIQLISRCKFFSPQFYRSSVTVKRVLGVNKKRKGRKRKQKREREKKNVLTNRISSVNRQPWTNSREMLHQRKSNSEKSFIDANILFDLDVLDTHHVLGSTPRDNFTTRASLFLPIRYKLALGGKALAGRQPRIDN